MLSCQSDIAKNISHFTTLVTYVILTEPPTKNNCFTATIYYVITLHGFSNCCELACKQKDSINFAQWPLEVKSQNYLQAIKLRNSIYNIFVWTLWSSIGRNLLELKIQYWANMMYLIAFLFMAELIHCYTIVCKFQSWPGQENNNQCSHHSN